MRRRSALGALVGSALAWAGMARSASDPSAAAKPGPQGFVVWGGTDCWLGEPGRDLQRLPGDSVAGIAPRAEGDSVWRVARDGALERWQRDAAGPPRLAWRRALAQPAHALAVAEEGRFVLAAHGEQASVLDGAGEPIKVFEGRDASATRRGAAQSLFAHAQRRSFVAAWPALGEVWEIPLDPQAPPIFEGLVHDYRMGEAIATRGYLGVRRSPLGLPLPDLRFADARVPWVAGTLDDAVAVVHLDVRRRIAALPLPGARPEGALLGPGERDGRGAAAAAQWWVPAGDAVQVVDTSRWQLLERRRLPGPVLALQALGGTVWAVVGAPGAGTLHLLRGAEWQRADEGAGDVQAMAVDASGGRMLVAMQRPSRVALLDAEGRALERWALPASAQPGGVVASR